MPSRCSDVIGTVFTDDADVNSIVAALAPIAALFQVLDGLVGVCGGVFRGPGRQKLVMYVNIFAFWLLGARRRRRRIAAAAASPPPLAAALATPRLRVCSTSPRVARGRCATRRVPRPLGRSRGGRAWWGLTLGLLASSAAYVRLLVVIDWPQEARNALIRSTLGSALGPMMAASPMMGDRFDDGLRDKAWPLLA